MNETLPAIPIVDVREGGPALHARQCADKARSLRDACLGFFPGAARSFIPALDAIARRWLMRSRSPYVAEIAEIAAALGFSGVWLLNASYQWACTSLAREQDGVPWLARTLDWPFLGLGRFAEVARMHGRSGDFFSVTWPGYVGVLTAMAPQRFAACVNQAPMWRRTRHRWLRPFDFAVNALKTWFRTDRVPPDQLLRVAFESCTDYATARRLLETAPISRPVIYILVGCTPGERCVIERTEDGFLTRENETCAANDWMPRRDGWEGRIGTRRFLTSSFDDAASYSRNRRDTLADWHGSFATPALDWVREPVLNPYTRLAVVMCPARGILRATGYDVTGQDASSASLPEPVTQTLSLEGVLAPA